MKQLIALFFLTTSLIVAQDSLIFKSPNGRYDCSIICNSTKDTYSETFLKLLAESKMASNYKLEDSTILLDNQQSKKLSSINFKPTDNYVSANTCFHQRNYSLTLSPINYDTYKIKLVILTDYRIKSEQNFQVTLLPIPFLSKGVNIYKDINSNFKLTVVSNNTIFMENLFIENTPCPKTILHKK